MESLIQAMNSSGISTGGAAGPAQSSGGSYPPPAPADALTKQQLEETMKAMLMPPGADSDQSALDRFCSDLTQSARQGKLDPVIGRDEEIRRCVHILCRRTKNNPILVGESGVGKTAIVEGLAQRIVAGDVPVALFGATIMELDLGSLAAGCLMPGEFEDRLKAVLQEIQGSPRKIILFIDDIHNLVPSAANQGASMLDGGTILKPALSRGELRVVGASSLDKFKKTIEKDPGLERRLQQVLVEQPGVPETISILRGLRSRYERYHGITISEGALIAAASLSHRYINGRFLPDKAIDLMDEATAQVKMEKSLKPEAVDSLERRIRQVEGERKDLVKKAAVDRVAATCLMELDQQLKVMKKQKALLDDEVESERGPGGTVDKLKREVARQKYKLGRLVGEDQKDEKETEGQRLAGLEEQLKDAETAARLAARQAKYIREEVTEADVARVISKWTGIPLAKLVASEKEKLLSLSESLHERIIGQDEAVAAVAEAIQRSRADLADPNGPIASFMFLGPTGVGKTELAKALAAYLFHSEDALVRLDMSEYMEKHSVSRLIGAPPGYVGYDEGGLLTDAVRRRPYAVVLFDEIEKAHVDVFNILLQILDDGRVTDTQGRLVSFKNCLIIMTSNLGSAEIFRDLVKSHDRAEVKERVMDHVRGHFRPEFINRVDEFITFDPLKPEQIKEIVQLRAQRLVDRMADKRMKLQLEDSAVSYLAEKGYDPVYGARPVKRALQRELQTLLAKALLRGQFEEEDTVVVECGKDQPGLSFRRIPADPEVLKARLEQNARLAEQDEPVVPHANGHSYSHIMRFNGVVDEYNQEEEEEEAVVDGSDDPLVAV